MSAERHADPPNSVRKWYKDISLPNSDAVHLARVTYQRPGRRRHRASALVDTSRVPDPKAAIEALLGQLAYFGGPDTSSDEMPTTAGVRRLLRVSELPPDEQAEVRSAMALFHAFAEHQAGAGQGTPDSVQEQARADSATFMRQWQTEAIIMGVSGCLRNICRGLHPG